MINLEELARRLCTAGHPVQRSGLGWPCATHIQVARFFYPLIDPVNQPEGRRVISAVWEALEEVNPPAPPIVAVGQVGLDEAIEASTSTEERGLEQLGIDAIDGPTAHPPVTVPVFDQMPDRVPHG